MAFSKDDQAKAKTDKKVLVGLFVNGKAVPGFEFQQFSRTEAVSPDAAKAIITSARALFDADANTGPATSGKAAAAILDRPSQVA